MEFRDLKLAVEEALRLLCKHDYVLIRKDASEWAIAHRLAVYLENIIPNWHVDCEYNRQGLGNDPKVNQYAEKVRPDIILHHREMVEREHNFVVIEVKKNETDEDSDKVKDYTSPPSGKRTFQYQYGLTLSFLPELNCTWFQNGNPVAWVSCPITLFSSRNECTVANTTANE